jgi:hypothetical protein
MSMSSTPAMPVIASDCGLPGKNSTRATAILPAGSFVRKALTSPVPNTKEEAGRDKDRAVLDMLRQALRTSRPT